MPKWLKITLAVVAALMVLGTALVVAAGYWFAKNKDELLAMGNRAKLEGEQFGNQSDADGCISEALRRLDADNGFMAQVQHRLFLVECLRVAPRSDAFCDEVPAPSAIMETVAYAMAACNRLGHQGDQPCTRLMGGVQEACHKPQQ